MTAGETTLGDYIKSDLPLDEGSGGSEANLVPCSNCGRKFAEERVETHKKICISHPERQVKAASCATTKLVVITYTTKTFVTQHSFHF